MEKKTSTKRKILEKGSHENAGRLRCWLIVPITDKPFSASKRAKAFTESNFAKGFGKQVPLAEKAKVFEIIQPREFGKLVPYLRYKGCLLRDKQVALTRATRLLNKSTADR